MTDKVPEKTENEAGKETDRQAEKRQQTDKRNTNTETIHRRRTVEKYRERQNHTQRQAEKAASCRASMKGDRYAGEFIQKIA